MANTTRFGIEVPDVGADADTWGTIETAYKNSLEAKVFDRTTGDSIPAGTAALPSLSASGDTDTGLFFPTANTVALSTGGVERLRVDSSGNLGLGVTPSAWQSSVRAIQNSAGAFYTINSVQQRLSLNAYRDSAGVGRYINSSIHANELRIGEGDGSFQFHTAPSGTAGNTITFTQAMTLTQGGQHLVGTPSNLGFLSNSIIARSSAGGPVQHLVDISGVGGGGRGAGLYFATVTNDTGPVYSEMGSVLGLKDNATQGNSQGYLAFYSNGGGGLAERARITSTGNLLVGTTTDGGERVRISQPSAGTAFRVTDAATTDLKVILTTGQGTSLINEGNAYLAFGTSNTERARITSGGYFKASNTGTYQDANGAFHETLQTTNNPSLQVVSTSAGYTTSLFVTRVNGTAAGTGFDHITSIGSAANTIFRVRGDGQIFSTSTSITAISDQRLKENIRDLPEALPSIVALKPRVFDWKEGRGRNVKDDRGFIAQEFETVFPDMVEDWVDKDETYKALRADLIPVLVKALQEANAKIEKLTERITTLEQK